MTSGLVNASFSLPEWQAVKRIFFAPWCVKGTDESLSTWDRLVPFMHHDSIDFESFILMQINPKECRVLSLEQRSLTERTISALAKGKSYTFVGQGQNEEACIELKLRLLSVNWYDFNTLTHQLYNVFTCDSREGHSPLPRLSNSGWTIATKQNGSWSSRQVCELWGVCWSHLQDCYWYPVVNDENVDSPSLAISDIPIYLPSWLPLLFIFSFIPISLHLKLCHQVIDNNVFEE